MLQPSRSSLYWCALVLQFSLGACCAKKPCEDRLHTSETLFSAPQWFCTFWKSPHYYSAGDFKHFPNSFWCSLMHSHAQHSLSSRSTGCVFIIKALLTHMITGMAHWHMPSPLGNQKLIFFPPSASVFPSIILWLEWVIQPPLWWCACSPAHFMWFLQLNFVKEKLSSNSSLTWLLEGDDTAVQCFYSIFMKHIRVLQMHLKWKNIYIVWLLKSVSQYSWRHF